MTSYMYNLRTGFKSIVYYPVFIVNKISFEPIARRFSAFQKKSFPHHELYNDMYLSKYVCAP